MLDLLRNLFRSPFDEPRVALLYGEIMHQSRYEVFYTHWQVPDTLEGRYEILCLHMHLVLYHLRRHHGQTQALAQAVFDYMFADMDQNLREAGVGDTGIGKRIRKMAEAFYGRMQAYDTALGSVFETLEMTIARNVYHVDTTAKDGLGDVADACRHMANYVRDQDAALRSWGVEDMLAGVVHFPPPPALP